MRGSNSTSKGVYVSAERSNVPTVVELAAPVTTSTLHSSLVVPAMIADAGDRAARRFLDFFAASIENDNTRMAYASCCMLHTTSRCLSIRLKYTAASGPCPRDGGARRSRPAAAAVFAEGFCRLYFGVRGLRSGVLCPYAAIDHRSNEGGGPAGLAAPRHWRMRFEIDLAQRRKPAPDR
jgi:hypothetical protein